MGWIGVIIIIFDMSGVQRSCKRQPLNPGSIGILGFPPGMLCSISLLTRNSLQVDQPLIQELRNLTLLNLDFDSET